MLLNIRKPIAILCLTTLVASGWVDKDLAWVNSRKNYWAFKKPQKAALPPSKANTNPIDAFLADARAAKGVKPSPQASREKLYRRLALDLTGLPPNPAELDRFLLTNPLLHMKTQWTA